MTINQVVDLKFYSWCCWYVSFRIRHTGQTSVTIGHCSKSGRHVSTHADRLWLFWLMPHTSRNISLVESDKVFTQILYWGTSYLTNMTDNNQKYSTCCEISQTLFDVYLNIVFSLQMLFVRDIFRIWLYAFYAKKWWGSFCCVEFRIQRSWNKLYFTLIFNFTEEIRPEYFS